MAGVGPLRVTVIVNSYVENSSSRIEDSGARVCGPIDAMRLIYSIWALHQLANIFDTILLADGSDYASVYKSLNLKNVKLIKQLELSKAVFLGKGYNEGALFRCLTGHLGNGNFILKITSRYVVQGLWVKRPAKSGDDIWFSALISGGLFAPQIDTRVVLLSRRFFEELFLEAATYVNDKSGDTLERNLYTIACNRSAEFRFSNFSLRGFCGHGQRVLSRSRLQILIRMVVGWLRWKLKI